MFDVTMTSCLGSPGVDCGFHLNQRAPSAFSDSLPQRLRVSNYHRLNA